MYRPLIFQCFFGRTQSDMYDRLHGSASRRSDQHSIHVLCAPCTEGFLEQAQSIGRVASDLDQGAEFVYPEFLYIPAFNSLLIK